MDRKMAQRWFGVACGVGEKPLVCVHWYITGESDCLSQCVICTEKGYGDNK